MEPSTETEQSKIRSDNQKQLELLRKSSTLKALHDLLRRTHYPPKFLDEIELYKMKTGETHSNHTRQLTKLLKSLQKSMQHEKKPKKNIKM